MANNNNVELIGILGDDMKVNQTKDGNDFGSARLATKDSWKDKETEEWIEEKESTWHDLLIFSPTAFATFKGLKKGTRVRVLGKIDYKPREVTQDGKTFNIHEASIIVRKVEQAPLVKKS